MGIFIKGTGLVAPVNSLDNLVINKQKKYLTSLEPDYSEYVATRLLRRMSRILKMGVTAAKMALDNADLQVPDAIITGTGLGCIEDTEKFLNQVFFEKSGIFSPTPFVRSTHNAISSQIAILLDCQNYNNCFSNKAMSFESALLDSILLFKDGSQFENVLTGGFDELTENLYKIQSKLGCAAEIENNDILKSRQTGYLAGEGAVFFVLSSNKTKALAKLSMLECLFKPAQNTELILFINGSLKKLNLNLADIDLIFLGINGDSFFDENYYYLINNYFNNNLVYYKHFCGEYYTSSAFALWMAAQVIKAQKVPEEIKINNFIEKKINRVLIYNHNKNKSHSLILLEKC